MSGHPRKEKMEKNKKKNEKTTTHLIILEWRPWRKSWFAAGATGGAEAPAGSRRFVGGREGGRGRAEALGRVTLAKWKNEFEAKPVTQLGLVFCCLASVPSGSGYTGRGQN